MDGYSLLVCFFALWIVVHYTVKAIRTASRERSRREIAAYIAEGSMTPEQGERLLKAAKEPD